MSIILCLDPGTAHTGIAISQERILATPLTTIFEKDLDRLVGRLIPVLARYGPEKIVIGLPSHGPLVSFAQNLGERLKKVFLGEIVFYTEDMSSANAKKILKESRKSLFSRQKEEHQTAAAIILQEYLENL